jgi:hypothetical protein
MKAAQVTRLPRNRTDDRHGPGDHSGGTGKLTANAPRSEKAQISIDPPRLRRIACNAPGWGAHMPKKERVCQRRRRRLSVS